MKKSKPQMFCLMYKDTLFPHTAADRRTWVWNKWLCDDEKSDRKHRKYCIDADRRDGYRVVRVIVTED